MRPVLIELANPSPLVYLAIFVLIAAGVLTWGLLLRRRQALVRDHIYVGAGTLVMAAVLLFILNRA